MRKVILPIVALAAMVSWDCATQRASGDGAQVAHARKVHHAYQADCVAFDRCGAPVGCPSRYSCYSLYGGTDLTVARPTGAATPMVAGSDRASSEAVRPPPTQARLT
jgi:hypothetical protein